MTVSEDQKPPSLTVDELYDAIRGEILHGVLEAGSTVSQVQLARRLDVNRTPLREALRMLQRERLIEGEYNRRVRIAELSSQDLEQLYAIRIVQESVAIRLSVPRLTDADFMCLDRLLDEMERHADPDHFADWERCHREYHSILTSRAGDRIAAAVNDLSDYCERYRRALVQHRPVATYAIGAREHAAIVAACKARDVALATQELARHLGRTALSLISLSDPMHDPVAVRESLRMIVGDVPPPTPFRE